MNVVQSYLATIMHGNFSKFEVRIFLKIVERAQEKIKEMGGPQAVNGVAVPDVGVSRRFSFPAKELYPDGVVHYKIVQDAVVSLMSKIVQHYDSQAKVWRSASIISEALIDGPRGLVSFSCSEWVLGLILDFSRSFSSYDMEVAMSLRSPYTARFYMLVNSMKQPLSFKVSTLRGILGCEEIYPKTSDLIKRVIAPASRELEKANVNGFDYKTIRRGDASKSPIVMIQIVPVKRQSVQSVVARAPVGAWVPGWLKDILIMELGFDAAELGRVKVVCHEFAKLPNAVNRIDIIIRRARIKRKGHGYIINAMKSEVQQAGISLPGCRGAAHPG